MLELAMILGFFLVRPYHAVAEVPVNATVTLSEGAELGDKDFFVAWGEGCSKQSDPGKQVELIETNGHYEPRALAAEEGQTLLIHNGDTIRHNSFANKPVEFDSGLQRPGTEYSVKLNKPGITRLFCRIHSRMAAELLVLKNPCFVALNGPKELASFSLPHLSHGANKVWLWSPRLKAFLSQAVTVGGKDAKVEFKIAKSDLIEVVREAPELPEKRGLYGN